MNLAHASMESLEKTMGSLDLPESQILWLLFQAMLAGSFFMLMTAWASTRFPVRNDDGSERMMPLHEAVQASSNVLFLCFGMCGIMILVNNSLARAFAIGAAISLVRFRIKLNEQALGAALFFGVLTGMAFGVNQPKIGWILASSYLALMVVVNTFASRSKTTSTLKASETSSINTPQASSSLGSIRT